VVDPGGPKRVKITNPANNGKPYLRRKDADYYVRTDRAVWVGVDQIRLIDTHPRNRAAREAAAHGYEGNFELVWAESDGVVVMQTRRVPHVGS
jgi:hypothetical protein